MNVERDWADKRWLHGRSIQLATRLRCWVQGHDFGRWYFDWDEDQPDWPDEGELLLWIRTCQRNCGCVETARACLAEAHRLPGGTGGCIYQPTFGRPLPD